MMISRVRGQREESIVSGKQIDPRSSLLFQLIKEKAHGHLLGDSSFH